ncbi:MAG: type II toxin-antitoxin system VapC family toxin [Desulfuromonadales bacterium]|nr:type II toxin-antitoxin system VapC family toxin [Desulfuromonadales bacterium]
MYVLDTNTLIYFFKGVGNVAKNLLNHSPREIGIPSIVLFELEVGIAKSSAPDKRMEQLEEIISIVSILDFTAKEAKVAAAIRAQLEKAGTPIGPFDTLIGATALANQSTLVTHNTKEFSRIAKLQIEDWY